MTRARSESYDLDSTTLYHCISRCVRRAFLCGTDSYTGQCFEHRKDWIELRLFFLAQFFAIEIYAFAILSNHLHCVIRINRSAALAWTQEEVIERYTKLFKNAKPMLEPLQGKARDELIEAWRSRLYDISWFMRMLNEDIARRANKEDEVTGRFWEGRFKCQPLLDTHSLITCMAYVDLNHVRAGITRCLDTEVHSSISRRLAKAEASPATPVPNGLVPFDDQTSDDAEAKVPMSLRDYVELLEWTGRCRRKAKSGRLRRKPPKLLQRLSIDVDAWLDTMQPEGLRNVSVLGSAEKLGAFATKHGKRWVRGKSLLKS